MITTSFLWADNLITVETSNNAKVIAMDNGYPADLNDMNDNQHHVYKGLGLAIIKGLKKGSGSDQSYC